MRQARMWIAGKARGLGLLAVAVLVGGIAGGALPSLAASGGAVSHHAQHKASPHASDGPDAPDAGGVHGQCVSKVARDKSAVGGPHHNHGGAVSAAAHSCPHG
jgi:hypothetical protein